jgi:hypothetical protein
MRWSAPLLLAAAAAASAQPVTFGSADDLFERGSEGVPVRDGATAAAFGGLAYLPDQWRGAVRLEADVQRGALSLGVGQTLHPTASGLYGPEADAWLDATRVLRYVRRNATVQSRWYARLGPVERVTLGSGALVRQFRTTTAWDERRLGVEAAVEGDRFSAGAFASDVRLTGLAGAEAEVTTPFAIGPVSALRLSVAAVHDLQQEPGAARTGIEARVRGRLWSDGAFALLPFVTHARVLDAGATVGMGLDARADNVGNAVRASARAAVFVSTPGFVPGAFGPFYDLQNRRARIAEAPTFYDDALGLTRAGTPLDSLRAGVDLVLDARLLSFGRYEVSQHIRRHFGPDRASAYGVRLAARLPRSARIEFALERQGFRGLLGLLRSLGEENQLVLDLAAPLGTWGTLLVQSRYGYRRLSPEEVAAAGADPDARWYLVERRFEPMVGVRWGL